MNEHKTCATPMTKLGDLGAWCPGCGALYFEGHLFESAAIDQLMELYTELEPTGIFPAGRKVPTVLALIRDRLDERRIGEKVMLRHYAELYEEVVELRKRRDGLLDHNNELVAQRREAERRAEYAEARKNPMEGI